NTRLIEDLKFRKLKNHYYNATISGQNSDWLKNIISQESEVIFLDELCDISKQLDNKFDWWMFSKINEHYDKKLHIPYNENSEEKLFYPDFIFWLQKDDKQTILFFDPKGTKHTDYQIKLEGYQELFELNDNPREFFINKNKNKIEVKLAFYKINTNHIHRSFEKYWVQKDSLINYFEKL
ncbi:MAG: restriction endonuclease subunit R, partial [Arcobacteraceae bacterium]